MGCWQSKERGETEETQQEEAPVKRSADEKHIINERSETATQGALHCVAQIFSGPTLLASTTVEIEKIKVPTDTTDTQVLSLSLRQSEHTNNIMAKNDDKKRIIAKGTQPEDSEHKLMQPSPVHPNLKVTTIPQAIGTVSGSHCEDQHLVEKKLLTVGDASRSLLLSGSCEVTAETSRDGHGEEIVGEDRPQGPRTEDECDHVSKKSIRKMRHKRTRRHGK